MHMFTVGIQVPDELRDRFEERVREHGGDQEQYLRQLLERDLRAGVPHARMTFREIFAPSQEGFAASGMTGDELGEFVEAEVKAYRAEKRASERQGG